MLFRNAVLEQIKRGEVHLAFRRWKKLSVKPGTKLKTAIGMVEIQAVQTCNRTEISNEDAQGAGYQSLEDLLHELDQRPGTIYGIQLAFGGADPRIALRENADLTPEQAREIHEQLQRYDRASRQGDWTLSFLELVRKHPMMSAGDLANKAGVEKEWLKVNVRKLKNLGLTISHQPGYELSPRGHEFLRQISET